jgi:hypothetical protein
MAWEACTQAGLALSPITAAQIRAGQLHETKVLMVPGGWPALKRDALGREGLEAVRRFVETGGVYFGLCGGAGLALDVEEGLGLAPLGRAAPEERLPNLSGPVFCTPGPKAQQHPLWQGLIPPVPLPIWWPSQFEAVNQSRVQVLARYKGPAPGMYSADLEVNGVSPQEWEGLEKDYGMRLNPASLQGLPAVIQASCGKGTVLLSYLHFDTPGDPNGKRVLQNLWQEWLDQEPRVLGVQPKPPLAGPARTAADLGDQAQALWDQGWRLGLWRPRHPAMPLWRRGARGLEFWTLLRLTRALSGLISSHPSTEATLEHLQEVLSPIFMLGPVVLSAQAARLEGNAPDKADEAAEQCWFAEPRRVNGELALALKALEASLLQLIGN